MRTTRHTHARSAAPKRRLVWARTGISLTTTAAAPQRLNLCTNLDASIGLFVSKGWTVMGIRGQMTASNVNDALAQVNRSYWGVIMADPNLAVASIDPSLTSTFNLRWLWRDSAGFATSVAAPVGGAVAEISTRMEVNSRVRARWRDDNDDLWVVMASTAGVAVQWQGELSVLLAMP